jgi:hypothetical protein
MKLNPIFQYIKNKKTFSFSGILKNCKVVDPYYLSHPFIYMLKTAMIKSISDPMPKKIIIGKRLADYSDIVTGVDLKYEDVYGYSINKYSFTTTIEDLCSCGVFHKTEEFKNELGNMTNPFVTDPFGYIVDLDSNEFKNEYFSRRMYGKKKKYCDLRWDEMANYVKDEIERSLYYIAIHYHNSNGFKIGVNDRTTQWQRIVDIGVEFQNLYYEFEDEKCILDDHQKSFEMFKFHWMINSETENMC